MTNQPEALWLADVLEELDGLFSSSGACGEAAVELRRQHVEIERLRAIVRGKIIVRKMWIDEAGAVQFELVDAALKETK